MARRTNRTTLYSEQMRWEPLPVKGSDGYAWIKTLSKDAETGARTALIRYEPGFIAPAAVATWPVDMYVLEGEMQAGDRRYEKHTYHYRPAGTPIRPIRSQTGITRLVFTADSKDPGRSSPDEVFIQSVERDVPWDAGGGGQTRAISPERKTSQDALMEEKRLRRNKSLRTDRLQGIRIWIYACKRSGLRNMIGEMHAHPYHEELFMVEGGNMEYMEELDGHVRWGPGFYLCRPPGECPHGDTLKLTDSTYCVVRTGWTDDPQRTAQWKAEGVRTTVPLRPLGFEE